jgi:BTB/POZ domain
LINSNLTSAIITLVVGPDQRLFAAHEDVLCVSSFFQSACRGQFLQSNGKRIILPEESPEILSSILEFLYKGDYYPKLLHNKRKDTWELEDRSTNGNNETTIHHHAVGGMLLKDTVI